MDKKRYICTACGEPYAISAVARPPLTPICPDCYPEVSKYSETKNLQPRTPARIAHAFYRKQNGKLTRYQLRDIPQNLWHKIKYLAVAEKTSMRVIIILALHDYLANWEKTNETHCLCEGCWQTVIKSRINTVSDTISTYATEDIKICNRCYEPLIGKLNKISKQRKSTARNFFRSYGKCQDHVLYNIPNKLWERVKYQSVTENRPIRSILIHALWKNC